MTQPVFVYGILKKHATREEEFTTAEPNYQLFSLGGFPGAKLEGNQRIKGRIVDADESLLRRFDGIEGHPNFYCREQVSIEGLDEPAWMYLYRGPNSGSSRDVFEREDGSFEWAPQRVFP